MTMGESGEEGTFNLKGTMVNAHSINVTDHGVKTDQPTTSEEAIDSRFLHLEEQATEDEDVVLTKSHV